MMPSFMTEPRLCILYALQTSLGILDYLFPYFSFKPLGKGILHTIKPASFIFLPKNVEKCNKRLNSTKFSSHSKSYLNSNIKQGKKG